MKSCFDIYIYKHLLSHLHFPLKFVWDNGIFRHNQDVSYTYSSPFHFMKLLETLYVITDWCMNANGFIVVRRPSPVANDVCFSGNCDKWQFYWHQVTKCICIANEIIRVVWKGKLWTCFRKLKRLTPVENGDYNVR